MAKEEKSLIVYRIGLILMLVLLALMAVALQVFDGGYDYSGVVRELRSSLYMAVVIFLVTNLFIDRKELPTKYNWKKVLIISYTVLQILFLFCTIDVEFYRTPGWIRHSLIIFLIWEAAYVVLYEVLSGIYRKKWPERI